MGAVGLMMRTTHKKYAVDQENQVVNCVMDSHPDIINIASRSRYLPVIHGITQMDWHTLDMETISCRHIYAKAKCATEDRFDELTGRHLASSRSDLKYHKAMLHDLMLYQESLKRAMDECNRLINHEFSAIGNVKRHISAIANQ